MNAQQHVSRMTLREKCAQMVAIPVAFPDEDPDRTSDLVRKDGVGALVVRGGSVFEIPPFINWAQKVAKFPVLVLADLEQGGEIPGATAFPSAAAVAATGSADFAQTRGRHVGAEARALGIRMVLGPSVKQPLAKVAIDGYHYSKAAVCLRSFPDAALAEVASEAEAILVAHELIPDLDDELVASQSRAAILGSLRRELRFEGLVVTDALSKLGGAPELVERAANAGADLLLEPADARAAIDALEAAVKAGRVADSTVDRAVTRQLIAKERLGLFADRAVDVAQIEKVVGSPAHLASAQRMAAAVSGTSAG